MGIFNFSRKKNSSEESFQELLKKRLEDIAANTQGAEGVNLDLMGLGFLKKKLIKTGEVRLPYQNGDENSWTIRRIVSEDGRYFLEKYSYDKAPCWSRKELTEDEVDEMLGVHEASL